MKLKTWSLIAWDWSGSRQLSGQKYLTVNIDEGQNPCQHFSFYLMIYGSIPKLPILTKDLEMFVQISEGFCILCSIASHMRQNVRNAEWLGRWYVNTRGHIMYKWILNNAGIFHPLGWPITFFNWWKALSLFTLKSYYNWVAWLFLLRWQCWFHFQS